MLRSEVRQAIILEEVFTSSCYLECSLATLLTIGRTDQVSRLRDMSSAVTSLAAMYSDSRLPSVSNIISIIKLKQWLRSARHARDLSTHSAPAALEMGSPYYGGAMVLCLRKKDLQETPLTVLDVSTEREKGPLALSSLSGRLVVRFTSRERDIGTNGEIT